MIALAYPQRSLDWNNVSDEDIMQTLNQSYKNWRNVKNRLKENGRLPILVQDIAGSVFFRYRMLELDNEVPVASWITTHNPQRLLAYLAYLKPLITKAHNEGKNGFIDVFDIDVAMDALLDILDYGDAENIMSSSYNEMKFNSEAVPMWNATKHEVHLFLSQ